MTSVDNVVSERAREYWSEVLLAMGSTSVPRWTLHPTPGTARHEAEVPDQLTRSLLRLAADGAVSARSALLAAHAVVLAALSGEREVTTGYVADRATGALPLRLDTTADTWMDVIEAAADAERRMLACSDFPVAELAEWLTGTTPSFETVIDLTGLDPDEGSRTGGAQIPLPSSVMLALDAVSGDSGLTLRLRYRGEAFDRAAAGRIMGYYLQALEWMVRDLGAEHRRCSLLSAAELTFQLQEMAGPRRERPDRRFHELFEDRVRAHPDRVAAVQGETRLTYAELNARANHLAHALLARGLAAEDVVAVVTERSLGWMAAVIAIFKAGGVYLPVEPHFPADRIATTLARAGCRAVLTEQGATATLTAALDTLPGVPAMHIEALYAQEHPETDPGLEVAADRLAYIYFTSGSTGLPKGAMCEHAGMLNHLLAKIEDLEIGPGTVVAQTAPQCFDISLWQLVSALMVGGQTLIVDQSVILDVRRFVDTIVTGRVGVLQVVPSYLEVVLTYLEQHPRALPDLRFVSATGEALKKELTQRWFGAQPGIKLLNAYGLTETSDDTNHEVMDRVPRSDRVPLGPPIPNVSVYVVDEHLAPVPLGAPGEIVFSGVCVGRGYVNDPDRTAAAFLTDPHRPGERLYRAGDQGRWLPDGKLDFLGRRDSQVKVSGFRIEIGEIENALLGVPGVRDAAVVVAESPGRSRSLAAFYSAAQPQVAEDMRRRLGRTLPAYMVPTTFHWRDSLPLTGNGKVDKKALTRLAADLGAADDEVRREAPRTPTEQRLASAWAAVLGLPAERIGRRDHFFELGGTSLNAVRLAIALDRSVSLKDVARLPVLADLASFVDSQGAIGGQSATARPASSGS